MTISVANLAQKVSGTVIGDDSITIDAINTLEKASQGQLAMLLDEKMSSVAASSDASVLIVHESFECNDKILIKVEKPRAVMPIVLEVFNPKVDTLKGIHPTAVIDESADIGSDVAIGPYVVIAKDCVVGDNTVINSNVTIGQGAKVGSDCLLYSGVHVYHHCELGDRCIVHCGTVIGSDGFGYVPKDKAWIKVPQIGRVIIGNDVEIGSNASIDRGAIGDSIIGDGTKIDNLVHMAHNTVTGKSCAITAHVGFAGSTELGDNVQIAGHAAFAGHLKVGSNTVVLGKAGVTKDIPENSVVSGFPAIDHRKDMAIQVNMRKLPEMSKNLKQINRKLKEKGIVE